MTDPITGLDLLALRVRRAREGSWAACRQILHSVRDDLPHDGLSHAETREYLADALAAHPPDLLWPTLPSINGKLRENGKLSETEQQEVSRFCTRVLDAIAAAAAAFREAVPDEPSTSDLLKAGAIPYKKLQLPVRVAITLGLNPDRSKGRPKDPPVPSVLGDDHDLLLGFGTTRTHAKRILGLGYDRDERTISGKLSPVRHSAASGTTSRLTFEPYLKAKLAVAVERQAGDEPARMQHFEAVAASFGLDRVTDEPEMAGALLVQRAFDACMEGAETWAWIALAVARKERVTEIKVQPTSKAIRETILYALKIGEPTSMIADVSRDICRLQHKGYAVESVAQELDVPFSKVMSACDHREMSTSLAQASHGERETLRKERAEENKELEDEYRRGGILDRLDEWRESVPE